MSNTWVRFKKSGVAIGYAHFEGDVAEIAADKAELGMEQGIVVAAKPAEIEAAKAKIAAEKAKSAALGTPASRTAAAPSVSDSTLQSLLAQMKDMQAEIERLKAASAEPAKPATPPAA